MNKNDIIQHLASVIKKLSPEQCQTVSPKTGLYCLMPATHYYVGLAICSSCAKKLTEGGANPAPHPIEYHTRSN